MRARRATPRRREAPRWSAAEWFEANLILQVRSQGLCECCGERLRGQVERHHRVRRRDGGDRLANILFLLPDHHRHVTEHPNWARERGLICLSTEDPAVVPVLHWGERLVLLDDDGGKTLVT